MSESKHTPVARVAEVHMSRYTIEWTDGPLAEGTDLYGPDLAAEVERLQTKREELRKSVAAIVGADEATWPDHGNVELAVAAHVAILQKAVEQKTSEVERLRAENDGLSALQQALDAERRGCENLMRHLQQVEQQLRPVIERHGLDPEHHTAFVLIGVLEQDIAAERRKVEALRPTQAAADVLAERRRQVEAEGWTPEHDDEHDGGQMAAAGSAYALAAADHLHPLSQGDGCYDTHATPLAWPQDWEFKPADPRRMLVKAGALILAEIERLDRAALAASQKGGE